MRNNIWTRLRKGNKFGEPGDGKKDTNVVDYHIDWNSLAMLTPIARVGFCQMVKEAGAADAAAGL